MEGRFDGRSELLRLIDTIVCISLDLSGYADTFGKNSLPYLQLERIVTSDSSSLMHGQKCMSKMYYSRLEFGESWQTQLTSLVPGGDEGSYAVPKVVGKSDQSPVTITPA